MHITQNRYPLPWKFSFKSTLFHSNLPTKSPKPSFSNIKTQQNFQLLHFLASQISKPNFCLSSKPKNQQIFQQILPKTCNLRLHHEKEGNRWERVTEIARRKNHSCDGGGEWRQERPWSETSHGMWERDQFFLGWERARERERERKSRERT